MRTLLLLTGVTVAMAWTGNVQAQSSASSGPNIFNIIKIPKTFNINVQPNITNNSPMDYRNQNSAIGTTTYRQNTTGTAFPYKLGSMFYSSGRTNFFSSTTTFGSSVFPTPAQMSAAAPGYFRPFQMYRAAPIQSQ